MRRGVGPCPREVLKVSIAKEDGAPPSALSARSVLGGSGVSVPSACFIGTSSRWPPSSRHDRLGKRRNVQDRHPPSPWTKCGWRPTLREERALINLPQRRTFAMPLDGSSTSISQSNASSFAIPPNEPQRVDALRALDIMDSAPEIAYDEIAELAAQVCACPIGYISFVDDDRRWLKARYGLPSDATNAPRNASQFARPRFAAPR